MENEKPTALLSIFHECRETVKSKIGPDWKKHVFDKCEKIIRTQMEAVATDAATAALQILASKKAPNVLIVCIMATAAEMVEPE